MQCVQCGNEIKVGDVVFKIVRGAFTGGNGYLPDHPDYDPVYIEHAVCLDCMREWRTQA